MPRMSERDARAYLAKIGQSMPEPTRRTPDPDGSPLERALANAVHLAGLPRPEREVQLVPGRKFRSDFYWPQARLIVEVEGGTYSGGRHVRGKGFAEDAVKYNTLTLLGYRVIRVTEAHIRSGDALRWIEWGLESVPTD